MKVKRTSVSLPPRLIEAAVPLMERHFCTSFSDYVTTLIREDIARHESREARTAIVAEDSTTYAAPKPKSKLAG